MVLIHLGNIELLCTSGYIRCQVKMEIDIIINKLQSATCNIPPFSLTDHRNAENYPWGRFYYFIDTQDSVSVDNNFSCSIILSL